MRKIAKPILFALIMVLSLMGFCACGGGGSNEETMEITTVEETQAQGDKNISVYEELYNTYSSKMESAGDKYLKELESKAGDLSKDDLYDETVKMQDKLKKVYQEGTDAMLDATLESTDDDTDLYEEYLKKLEKKYTDVTQKLTEPYKDRF